MNINSSKDLNLVFKQDKKINSPKRFCPQKSRFFNYFIPGNISHNFEQLGVRHYTIPVVIPCKIDLICHAKFVANLMLLSRHDRLK